MHQRREGNYRCRSTSTSVCPTRDNASHTEGWTGERHLSLTRFRKAAVEGTPLCDESESFLKDLLGASDEQDPLHKETQSQAATTAGHSDQEASTVPRESLKRPAPTCEDEGRAKNTKVDDQPYASLIKAIEADKQQHSGCD